METWPWQIRAISPCELWKVQLRYVVFGSSSLKRLDIAQLSSVSELDGDSKGSSKVSPAGYPLFVLVCCDVLA